MLPIIYGIEKTKKNIFVSTGFNSIGVQSAGGVGKVMSEWITDEMKIEGEEVCDEETGICYAYAGATGTSVLPYSEDSPIFYQILFVDGNKTSSKTEVLQFVGADGGAPPADGGELPVLMIGVGVIFMALMAGFVVWARRPSSG